MFRAVEMVADVEEMGTEVAIGRPRLEITVIGMKRDIGQGPGRLDMVEGIVPPAHAGISKTNCPCRVANPAMCQTCKSSPSINLTATS